MNDLVKTAEKVNVGRSELNSQDLNFIYENYCNDLFSMISFVFKIGFARGQKSVLSAVKKAVNA